jgi:hypothetical protein
MRLFLLPHNTKPMENTLTIKDILDLLDEFIEDGNAVCIDGLWRTQCAQYSNRLTKEELIKYFIKEYYPEYNDKY